MSLRSSGYNLGTVWSLQCGLALQVFLNMFDK